MAIETATRISSLFAARKAEGRKAFIAYLTGGDPTPEHTLSLVLALERGGADLIELGVPFSDPIADGPVIQRASDRALRAGAKLHGLLATVRENSAAFRDSAAAVQLPESAAALWFRTAWRKMPPMRASMACC